jgi:hypothetical protein
MTNNSQNSQKSQWDFGRFMKTLSFFGAVPVLSNWEWFQQWFGSRPDPTVDSSRLAYHTASVSSSNPIQDTNSMLTHRPIFDFTQSTSNLQEVWGALDDVVMDLSEFDGIELRLKGDGNRYKFMLRTETRWDGIAHCHSFDTVADNWITVQIPFTAFIPVFRAKTVNNSPIDPSHIHAMQLMLSKFEYDGELNPHFQPGFFQLQVESIQAYRA